MPWFVSDTTKEDLELTLHSLETSDNENLRELASRWRKRFKDGDFEFRAHPFWTYGFPYYEMKKQSPDLYAELGKSSFLIFKGDLNYRKLVGDLEWKYDTPFQVKFLELLRLLYP
jgi:damage-control phosphatase, subfamily III